MNINTTDLRLYEIRVHELKKNLGHNFYYEAMREYEKFKDILSEENFKAILKHKKSRYMKSLRVAKKTRLMLLDSSAATNKFVFGTATLSNETLLHKDGTEKKIETLNKKINKWLNGHFKYVVVNVDYGEQTERLHYHFIGTLKENEKIIPKLKKNGKQAKSKKGFLLYVLEKQDYKLAFEPTIEIAPSEDIYNKRISNYLIKINKHSNKPSTRNHRIRVLGDKEYIKELGDLKEYLKYRDKNYNKII